MPPGRIHHRILAAGIGGIALMVGLAVFLGGSIGGHDTASTPAAPPAARESPGIRVSTTRYGRPTAAYMTWTAPGTDSLLMIPTVAADGTAWAGQLGTN